MRIIEEIATLLVSLLFLGLVVLSWYNDWYWSMVFWILWLSLIEWAEAERKSKEKSNVKGDIINQKGTPT